MDPDTGRGENCSYSGPKSTNSKPDEFNTLKKYFEELLPYSQKR